MENNPRMVANTKRIVTNERRMAANSLLFVYLFVAISGILFIGIRGANAASLYFSPSSGSYAVGAALSVSVYVASSDQAMNAASGAISFPQDKLEVVSLSKTGSLFSLWVQEPSFSNAGGTVNFEGIVLNPGFTGAAGKVITINFKVKTAGLAPLAFSSGSALANDGKGTNILAGLGKAAFSLGGATPPAPESKASSAVSDVPSAPQISSPTHPDPNKWYADKNPKFEWTLPAGVNGVNVLANRVSNADPGTKSDGLIHSYTYEDVDDGVWYFHLRFRNAGGWGKTSHFRFQIDTEPPKPFAIKFIDGNETKNPRPTVVFDTADALSGIDYYKIKIHEGDFFTIAPDTVKSNPYTLPFQSPGKRNILVQAFDKAENYAVATEEFMVAPSRAPAPAEYPQRSGINPWYAAAALGALVMVGMLFWRGRHDDSLLRRRLRKEVREAGSASHRAFDLLREETHEQIKTLEKARTKRDLTAQEEKVIQRLKKNIEAAEKFVKKEIDDIAREVS